MREERGDVAGPWWTLRAVGVYRAFICAVSLAVLIGISGCGPREGLEPGSRPPSVPLKDLETGESRTLDYFKPSVVLVNYWASWCAPCVVEMPELQKLHEALSPKGFAVVGIGVSDSEENLKAVAKKTGITFPILVDREGKSRQAYRIAGFPESFVLGKEGAFAMVLDPQTGEPTIRIIGPRPWSQRAFQEMFEPLLQ